MDCQCVVPVIINTPAFFNVVQQSLHIFIYLFIFFFVIGAWLCDVFFFSFLTHTQKRKKKDKSN